MKIRVPSGPIRPVLAGLDEIEILHGFVAAMEDSAMYQRKKLEESGWEIIEEEDRLYHTIHGIDGDTWHLETLFGEWFPALQRSATFLMAWGAFEHHLDELCREIAAALELKIMPADLRETGVSRANLFDKSCGVQGCLGRRSLGEGSESTILAQRVCPSLWKDRRETGQGARLSAVSPRENN